MYSIGVSFLKSQPLYLNFLYHRQSLAELGLKHAFWQNEVSSKLLTPNSVTQSMVYTFREKILCDQSDVSV